MGRAAGDGAGDGLGDGEGDGEGEGGVEARMVKRSQARPAAMRSSSPDQASRVGGRLEGANADELGLRAWLHDPLDDEAGPKDGIAHRTIVDPIATALGLRSAGRL
jgi:hypothetical protein